MTFRHGEHMSVVDEKIRETRNVVYRHAAGHCEICGKTVPLANGQMAHRIPKRKHFLDKYTEAVIHSELNMKWTCPTDECNSAASIAGDPKQIEALVAFIVTEIMSEVTARVIRHPKLYATEFKRIAKIAEGEVY